MAIVWRLKQWRILTHYDFDVSFVRGLSLEDGAATLTDFTASIIGEELSLSLKKSKKETTLVSSLSPREIVSELDNL